MIQFDTLAFVRRLTAAGFAREQAEAIVEGLAAADTSQVASRTDVADVKAELADVKAELKADIADVKAELKADNARLELKLGEEIGRLEIKLGEEIGRLEIKLGEFKTELFRHMLVQTGVIVGAVIALMKLIP